MTVRLPCRNPQYTLSYFHRHSAKANMFFVPHIMVPAGKVKKEETSWEEKWNDRMEQAERSGSCSVSWEDASEQPREARPTELRAQGDHQEETLTRTPGQRKSDRHQTLLIINSRGKETPRLPLLNKAK